MKKKESSKKNNSTLWLAGVSFLCVLSTSFAFCYMMNYSLLLPLLVVFLGVQLAHLEKMSYRKFLNLGLLFTILVFTVHAIDQYSGVPYFYIPIAAVGILTILLYDDLKVAFVMSLLSSVAAALILGGDIDMMILFFLGSLAGIFAAKGARTRSRLIMTGLFVSAVHVVCLFLLIPDLQFVISEEFSELFLMPLIASGFLAALTVSATLKVFEYLFGVITNYSLLELSDFNQPLLKKLVMEAPGTYHHSLVVSNLAEAAADAIGANALLTRVGAYYHDIGKTVKSDYFTENQLKEGNKHDAMEPSMSRLVVLSHVKEGIELAKKYRLNPLIIDFIPQHHGTSLIYYFYQKAIEEAEEGEPVNENDFRYPGPKPQTRETAITLLADSVEGATRALDEQNPQNIEETVQKIVNNKFIDGQLDECPLTLKEIEKISSTFVKILTAMYHGRVKYPENVGPNGHNNRKQSDKNSASNQSSRSTDQTNPSQ